METALLLLLAASQLVVLLLLFGLRRSGRGGDRRTAALEEAVRRAAAEAAGGARAAMDRVREELTAAVEAVRTAVEGLASRLDREEGRAGPAPSPHADEILALLRETAECLDARLRELGDRMADGPRHGDGEAVRRALRRRGFERIVLIDRPVRDAGRLRFGVEAHRGGMLHKGWVALSGGEVSEVELAPAHRMFP